MGRFVTTVVRESAWKGKYRERLQEGLPFCNDAQDTCVTEGDKSMNFVLGGKGANLAEMSCIGLPVPGGFTITCQTCVEYSGAGNVWPDGVLDEIVAAEADLEARCGKKLATPTTRCSYRCGRALRSPCPV
ncbi:MAG: PEP/pyruvate-binding domain-containing protein [Collinsella sp.]